MSLQEEKINQKKGKKGEEQLGRRGCKIDREEDGGKVGCCTIH
jgi:hypothetical protein